MLTIDNFSTAIKLDEQQLCHPALNEVEIWEMLCITPPPKKGGEKNKGEKIIGIISASTSLTGGRGGVNFFCFTPGSEVFVQKKGEVKKLIQDVEYI